MGRPMHLLTLDATVAYFLATAAHVRSLETSLALSTLHVVVMVAMNRAVAGSWRDQRRASSGCFTTH